MITNTKSSLSLYKFLLHPLAAILLFSFRFLVQSLSLQLNLDPLATMSPSCNALPVPILLIITPIIFSLQISSSPPLQHHPACLTSCGSIPIKYPFGSGFGCGHPSFSSYLHCINVGSSPSLLQFTTTTGIYTITSIDYTTSTLIITDPLMSNCTSMQNSGSFTLDRAAPFSISDDDTFVLMGCSTSSPLFDEDEDLCDTGSGSRICKGVYSCKGLSGIGFAPNAPISTCCVYSSSRISTGGAGFSLDLPKLLCSSYTCIHGYGGDEGDPSKWSYGISLQFNTSYRVDDDCNGCEASGGICGFGAAASSAASSPFLCVCGNGVNTTNNCYGEGFAWSGTWRNSYNGIKKMIQGFLFLLFMIMVM